MVGSYSSREARLDWISGVFMKKKHDCGTD